MQNEIKSEPPRMQSVAPLIEASNNTNASSFPNFSDSFSGNQNPIPQNMVSFAAPPPPAPQQQQQPSVVSTTIQMPDSHSQLTLLPKRMQNATIAALARTSSILPDERILFAQEAIAHPNRRLVFFLGLLMCLPGIIFSLLLIFLFRVGSFGMVCAVLILVTTPLSFFTSKYSMANSGVFAKANIITNYRGIVVTPMSRFFTGVRHGMTRSYWFSGLTRDIFKVTAQKNSYSIALSNVIRANLRGGRNSGISSAHGDLAIDLEKEGLEGLPADNPDQLRYIESLIRAHSPLLRNDAAQPIFNTIRLTSLPKTIPYFLVSKLGSEHWAVIHRRLASVNRGKWVVLSSILAFMLLIIAILLLPAFFRDSSPRFMFQFYAPLVYVAVWLFIPFVLILSNRTIFRRKQELSDLVLELNHQFGHLGLLWRLTGTSFVYNIEVADVSPQAVTSSTIQNAASHAFVPGVSVQLAMVQPPTYFYSQSMMMPPQPQQMMMPQQQQQQQQQMMMPQQQQQQPQQPFNYYPSTI